MHQHIESFQVKVPGKWILTGEHAVLQGYAALALPLWEKQLTLKFYADLQPVTVWSVTPVTSQDVVQELLRTLQNRLGVQLPQGRFEILSDIPMGAGLGSSAALCVALVKWVSAFLPLPLPLQEQIDLAIYLEHRFHEKSSGIDVTVVAQAQPLSYVMGQVAQSFQLAQFPRFTFHDTQLRASTRDCVLKVQSLRHQDPRGFQQIDQAMHQATLWAKEGLLLYSENFFKKSLGLLQKAIEQAQSCFQAWNLVPPSIQNLLVSLKNQGALAAKLTGAGQGGVVVALWGHENHEKI